jgi:hypothetical protein
LTIWWILGFAVLVGLAIYGDHVARQKRKAALAQLAKELHCRFDPFEHDPPAATYSGLGAFARGHSRRAYNTLTGRVDVGDDSYALTGGDFLYKVTTSNGKTTTTSTHRFSYWIVHLVWTHCPSLVVRPEGFFDKIAGALGFDDIDFESEEFSRKFHVKSSDKKFAYDLIDPRMMEFLIPRLTTALQLEQGRLLLTNGSATWSPEEFSRQLAFANEFVKRWPEHLVRGLDEHTGARDA